MTSQIWKKEKLSTPQVITSAFSVLAGLLCLLAVVLDDPANATVFAGLIGVLIAANFLAFFIEPKTLPQAVVAVLFDILCLVLLYTAPIPNQAALALILALQTANIGNILLLD